MSLLGKIIKKVDKNYLPQNGTGENLVIIDSNGQIQHQKPGLFTSLKTYYYYLVNTKEEVAYDGYLCTLYGNAGASNIQVSYRIKCQDKDVELLAKNLHQYARPETLPNILMQEVVEKMHRENPVTDHFFNRKTSVSNQIIARLSSFGLTPVTIDLQLEGGRGIPTIKLSVTSFKATLLGTVPKASLGFDAVISVKQGFEATALRHQINEDVLEEELVKIIRFYLARNITPEDLLSNYNSHIRQKLEENINTYLESSGRQLQEFSLVLHKHGKLDAIIIKSENFFSTRLNDSLQPVSLKYECELVANPALHAKVLLFPVNTSDMEEVITDQFKTSFASEVDTDMFLDQLNTVVPKILADDINTKLAAWGRKVGFLRLEPDPQHRLSIDIEIDQMVECYTKDGFTVKVKTNLLMRRSAKAKMGFAALQVKDYSEWCRNELNRITKKHVINQTYNELRFNFQDDEIRKEIQEEAARLGYTVNQLITLPEFEKPEQFRRFQIDYKNYNLPSQVDGVQLALSVQIEGRIKNFNKIMEILAPKESVTESVEKSIDAKLRHFLHEVNPDMFYTQFHWINESISEAISLESKIKQEITVLVTEMYDADIHSIIVNQLNTPMILRLIDLKRGVFPFEFQDKNAHLKYKATINILSINKERWAVFSSRAYKPRSEDPEDTERKDIAKHITEFLENGLNTMLLPALMKGEMSYQDIAVKIETQFYPLATLQIQEIFGLDIFIYPPVRTTMEKMLREQFNAHQIAKFTAQLENEKALLLLSQEEKTKRLRDLYDQRKDLEKDDPSSNTIARNRINQEIAQIESSISNNKTSDMQQQISNLFSLSPNQLEDASDDANNNTGK